MNAKVSNIEVYGTISKEQAQQVGALLSSTRELVRLEEGLRGIFGASLGTSAHAKRTECGACNCSTGQRTCIVYEYIIEDGNWSPISVITQDCSWLGRLGACFRRLIGL